MPGSRPNQLIPSSQLPTITLLMPRIFMFMHTLNRHLLAIWKPSASASIIHRLRWIIPIVSSTSADLDDDAEKGLNRHPPRSRLDARSAAKCAAGASWKSGEWAWYQSVAMDGGPPHDVSIITLTSTTGKYRLAHSSVSPATNSVGSVHVTVASIHSAFGERPRFLSRGGALPSHGTTHPQRPLHIIGRERSPMLTSPARCC